MNFWFGRWSVVFMVGVGSGWWSVSDVVVVGVLHFYRSVVRFCF